MSVTVAFPDELLMASKESRDTFSRRVRVYTLGHLYQDGKISAGVGSKILGCDRLEFYRLLSEHGFLTIDLSPEELTDEAESSRLIAENVLAR